MHVVCDGKLVHKNRTWFVISRTMGKSVRAMCANDTNLAKRIALFHMASPVGSAASGYLVCGEHPIYPPLA